MKKFLQSLTEDQRQKMLTKLKQLKASIDWAFIQRLQEDENRNHQRDSDAHGS